MLETKKPFAAGLVLALLATTGCYDFKTAFDECVAAGQCRPVGCDPSKVDLPDDLFHDSNCDDFDGAADSGFFVDPSRGLDGVNPGTREAPFKTLRHALPVAADGGGVLYLARGDYNEPGLELNMPVSLYGGYGGVDGKWDRSVNHITRINGDSIGLTVTRLDPDAGVTLERLQINATQGSEPGAPSIGLRVQDASVRLRHVEVAAAAGMPGRAGDSASDIPHAADGGQPPNPVETPSDTQAVGGTPGLSACGTYRGGTGGKGGTFSSPATGGEGGVPSADGGTPGGYDYDADLGCSGCTFRGKPGNPGQEGFDGGNGMAGPAGNENGVLEGGTWRASAGDAGREGEPGGGGGGGGGGGVVSAGGSVVSKGGGGGGGGAGGCPGQGGKGGQGGGASIAVLVINGHVELESSSLVTAGGGKGGNGGRGGTGSTGGVGGPGGKTNSQTHPTYNVTVVGGVGGNGGNGGKGGNGGHGGNGAGGPSVGLWCETGSSTTLKDTRVTRGPAGASGEGPGPTNPKVLQQDVHNCLSTSP